MIWSYFIQPTGCESKYLPSNLFNILLVLCLATSIKPITISMFALFDIAFMVLITILLYLFMKKNNSLVRKQGIILVAIYIVYMVYTIIR